jgi:hypothetical protein
MSPRKFTVEPEVEAVPERVLTPEEELEMLRAENAALKAKTVAQSEEIDTMKKKEEGWLIVCNNPLYQGSVYGVNFTDGVAFIPKNRVYQRFVVLPYTEEQKEMILEDKVRHPHGEREIAEYAKSVAIPSSERMVKMMVSDFGYSAEFYTKDQMDDLQKKISARALERKEAQAKLDKEPTMLEKMVVPQRM